jgi:arsenite methyltransferase
VIGVDVNDEMLALARGAAPVVAATVGHPGVEFRKGRIQDLSLDLDAFGAWLAEHPVTDVASLLAMEAEAQRIRTEQPLVADGSVDVPEQLRADPALWSGCISGAYQEEAFLAAFERAGFHAVRLDKRDPDPCGRWSRASSSAASRSSPTRASKANAETTARPSSTRARSRPSSTTMSTC